MLWFRLLPETRCFALKSALLRWMGIKVGRGVRVCSSVTFLGNGCLEIGDDTWIGQQVLIICSSHICIGSNVDIGPRVFIGTGTHQLDPVGLHSAGVGVNKDVVVGNGAWLCASATILPGVSIGQKAVVAAGAVVTENVPDRKIVGGVPARGLKDLV
jgi:acetyltransferase-like isoleucine patch superfamily enzyme